VKQREKDLAAIGILTAVYFVAGKFGLGLTFLHLNSSAVWPPAGIALAALLLFGDRVWPGILFGALCVNLVNTHSVWPAALIATGNTFEALLGAHLVNRFARGRDCFDRARDTFAFAILAAAGSTAASATLGAATLCLWKYVHWADYLSLWLTWWLSDCVSVLVVTPVVVLWAINPHMRWSWARLSEFVALLMTTLAVSEIVFGPSITGAAKIYPLEYFCIPVLIWAAFRFSQREAATVTLLVSAMAIWGTVRGVGPFAFGTRNASFVLLQGFIGIVAVMTMALAAIFSERRSVEEQVRSLAITDPLTGLANYRKLLDVIDLEIKRFGRTGRSFAVLLLDLDDLKKINDRYGHLIGSRALCRLADILRVHCRSIDTPARYGGDEFAVVVAEAGAAEADHVVQRIHERIAAEKEDPAISASMGYSVYGRDGETIEELLAAADAALYKMKRHRHQQEQQMPLAI
jgi:diguanylate cyclase (GGDEF)-like protein